MTLNIFNQQLSRL